MASLVPFLLRHGYAVLFAVVLAEQLGVPVPALPALLAMGALAGMGKASLAGAFLCAFGAAFLSDSFWFLLGRRHGARILRLLCRISLEPDSCVRRTENVFAAQGGRALLFAKFIPGLNTVAAPVAGMMHMRPTRFLLWEGAGTTLWAGSYLLVGYLFSAQIDRVVARVLGLGNRLGLLLAASFALYLFLKYVQRRRFIREIAIARITPEELRRKLTAGEDIVVVDLRHSAEFEAGAAKVPGALQLSPEELDARHSEIPRDREVVLYCT